VSPNRRDFLRVVGAAAGAALGAPALADAAACQVAAQDAALRAPRGYEFVFARLRYDSGDWDYNPKVAANVLDAVVQYTDIPVYPQEIVIAPYSEDLMAFPFVFMTGHKLVRFTQGARDDLVRFVESGGLLFSDDCNHDVDGLYAKSFEDEMGRMFPREGTLAKLPSAHPLYRCFFDFPDGPPQTSHELNGWGDDMVHDYLRGVEHRGQGRGLASRAVRHGPLPVRSNRRSGAAGGVDLAP